MNSRLIVDVKVKTIELSNENTGKHLYNLEINKYFLNRTHTHTQLDKGIYLKSKGFFLQKNH